MAEPVEQVAEVVELGTFELMLGIAKQIFADPLNILVIVLAGYVLFKIIKGAMKSAQKEPESPPEVALPKLNRDFTVAELKNYDGRQPDGRVLVAVNGNVYDVTKGKRFYGPGGPYGVFGGRDASRGLATFSVEASDSNDYDDLSDLSAVEMDSVREWDEQFKEKYQYVGRLLRDGEIPHNYSDDEEETPKDTPAKTETEKKDE